jgi:NADH-quinone oxidoreductase subunit E
MDFQINLSSNQIGNLAFEVSEEKIKKGILVPSLQRIQEESGYLPKDELKRLSETLNIPLSEIYSVSSFYNHFYYRPRGKKILKVCTGTACHVRGTKEIVQKIKDKCKIDVNETTEDLMLTLETVGCLGCCGLAPVITVNETIQGNLTASDVEKLVTDIYA